jgi:thiamine kinase-like enzyme
MTTAPSTTLSPSSPSSCPQHILDHILHTQLQNCYELISIQEAKSAQQQVWILFLGVTQQNGELRLADDNNDNDNDITIDKDWKDCLESGRNRLVVRQWKGGCQWWNLHRNNEADTPTKLANSEVFGYQCARQSLVSFNTTTPTTTTTNVTIPRVLLYQENNNNNNLPPWAVLEYVGPASTYFDEESYEYDSYYLEGMVTTRHEFEFDEPHPRWGRVPEDQALDYATLVLEQVVLPLHRSSQTILLADRQRQQQVYTYPTMVHIYQDAWKELQHHAILTSKQHQQQPQQQEEEDPRMRQALQLVETAVTIVLPSNLASIPPLDPVLVHLDLQPQNLLFGRRQNNNKEEEEEGTTTNTNTNTFRVSSVLDWEDAAVADPRFDLVLLGRKVCANRQQAETLWDLYYQQQQKHRDKTNATNNNTNTNDYDLGPLRPWLQLETLHSIVTLLLQSMDLVNGGRNPWETSNDLWGKLQREFARWEEFLQSRQGDEQDEDESGAL